MLCVAAREETERGLWPKDLCDVLRTSVIGRGDKASDRMLSFGQSFGRKTLEAVSA